jgi:hypothetical protein
LSVSRHHSSYISNKLNSTWIQNTSSYKKKACGCCIPKTMKPALEARSSFEKNVLLWVV